MRKALSVIAIFTVSLSLLFCFTEKKIFSENENRNLSVFPEVSFENLFDSVLTTKIDEYINDHFPFRDQFLVLKSKVEVLMGNNLINGTYITDEYLFLKYEKNPELEKLVDKLNTFYENNIGVNMNLLLVPSSSYINSEYLPLFTDTSLEESDLEYVDNNLLFNNIDVVDNLLEYNKKYDVYFKTDHHYNIYGALASYEAFAKESGLNYNSDIRFTLANNKFLGTLSSKVNIFDKFSDSIYYYSNLNSVTVKYVAENKETNTLYNEEFLDQKDKYSFFLGGNFSLINIETSLDNDKEILIIKDSYANSFIPFLTDNYEEIHVIDLRFYNMSITDYIKENKIGEVLFIYSTSGFTSESGLNLLR